jgi:hypothetical protein
MVEAKVYLEALASLLTHLGYHLTHSGFDWLCVCRYHKARVPLNTILSQA